MEGKNVFQETKGVCPVPARRGPLIKSKRTRRRINYIILEIALIALSALFIYPFLWMILTSFKTSAADNLASLVVHNPTLKNYKTVFTDIPFFRFLLNTIVITVITIVGMVLSSSLVAYSFAKTKWPGRGFCFILVLATMMLPGQVMQIPTFILFKQMNMLDTYFPMVLPPFFGVGAAFNIFLTREFYKGIPNELSLAAKIDGCGNFRIWFRIMLPLCVPILLTITIFTFLATWNDVYSSLIYLQTEKKFPLALGLQQSFQGLRQRQTEAMMAGAVLSALPTLSLYFIFQKYFMGGISISSGVKG